MKDPVQIGSYRLPSLDGWRALCIILVLGFHCRFIEGIPPGWVPFLGWAFDGNLGVRCFFLISGLLITWLLLRERELTGTINLKHFYARRALRILPVYFAFIAVIFLVSVCTPFRQTARDWLANLTFTTDFFVIKAPTGHLWSLAVEEQFYLLWPFTLVFLLKRGCGWRVYAGLLLAVFVSAAVNRTLEYTTRSHDSRSALLSVYSFFNYWDVIAVGCTAAFILSRRPAWISLLAERPVAFAALGLSLFLVPYVVRHRLILGAFTVPFGFQCEALGMAILILQSIAAPQFPAYRVLNLRWVQIIGVLSYSIYIWQQIFCTNPQVYGVGSVWWLRFPGWLLPVFAVACLSYYGLELPFTKLRRRFRDAAHGDEQAPAAPVIAE